MKMLLSRLFVRQVWLVLLRRRAMSGYFLDGTLITGTTLTGGNPRETPNMIQTTKMDFFFTMISPNQCRTSVTHQ